MVEEIIQPQLNEQIRLRI